MAGGMTLVLVSHDAGTIEAVCERVVVLDEGRVAFDGPTADGLVAVPAAAGRPRGTGGARMRPEDAIAAARAEVERLKAAGGYAEPPEGRRIEPVDRVTGAQLLEWALIEPDLAKLRSTRRAGRADHVGQAAAAARPAAVPQRG